MLNYFFPPELPIQNVLRVTQILQESIDSRNQKGLLIPYTVFPIAFFLHIIYIEQLCTLVVRNLLIYYMNQITIFPLGI